MNTTRLATAARNSSLIAFLLPLSLTVSACAGSYGNGAGGGAQPPYITTQPANQTVNAGQAATFSVTATGTAPLGYQWQKNGADISGATSSSYMTPATTSSDNGSTFKVIVSNSAGSATSSAAVLTVNSGSSAAGWTFVQDNITTAGGSCTTGSNVCTIAVSNGNMVPTTAGSVQVVIISTGNNVTISQVCSGVSCSGTNSGWTPCPGCHVFLASPARNIDAWYNLAGIGGTTSITATLSGASSGLLKADLIELMPPPGSTASFDGGGAVSSASCITCTGVGLNLTGTDAVIEFQGIHDPNGWKAWSSPWMTDVEGNGLYLDAPAGALAAPSVVMANNQAGAVINALAFTSSLGSFTPPAPLFSVVNYTNPQGVQCSNSCALTIPATGSGHLLYLEAANQSSTFISSISGAGSWVVPGACQIAGASPVHALSCAYVLSSSSGVTSVNVTMTGSSNNYFAVWEIAAPSGKSFVLDGNPVKAVNPASTYPAGVALTLTGTSDVIFQSIDVPGGTSGNSLYPQPYNLGNGPQFWVSQAANVALLNTTDGSPPHFPNPQNNQTIVSGIAFTVQ